MNTNTNIYFKNNKNKLLTKRDNLQLLRKKTLFYLSKPKVFSKINKSKFFYIKKIFKGKNNNNNKKSFLSNNARKTFSQKSLLNKKIVKKINAKKINVNKINIKKINARKRINKRRKRRYRFSRSLLLKDNGNHIVKSNQQEKIKKYFTKTSESEYSITKREKKIIRKPQFLKSFKSNSFLTIKQNFSRINGKSKLSYIHTNKLNSKYLKRKILKKTAFKNTFNLKRYLSERNAKSEKRRFFKIKNTPIIARLNETSRLKKIRVNLNRKNKIEQKISLEKFLNKKNRNNRNKNNKNRTKLPNIKKKRKKYKKRSFHQTYVTQIKEIHL